MIRKVLSLGIIMFIIISTTLSASADEINQEGKIITFNDISRVDRSLTFELPRDAKVAYFSLGLSGPAEPGINQPQNISLDIGDNGTIDWSFKNEYGPLGYQTIFASGKSLHELNFNPEHYDSSAGIYLPVSAEVNKASLNFEYIEAPYLSAITELNRPEWHPDAPYEYDPELCEYNDRLFVAYRTYSWRDANQSDADIAINSTQDGNNWQSQITEITKAPDTEVPYTGGKRSGDFYPSLAVFNDKLYCAWESASVLPEGSTHGMDRDIVWSSFDGTGWSEPQELTAPDEQAAENIYSKNPGLKDDYRVQLCTFNNGSAEQLFAVWTANNTGDEWFPEERKGDIVISRTVDGVHWTVGQDLTKDDRRYDEDYLPQLVEFKTDNGNALFVFWVSNNFANTNGSDWDIVYRFSYDGITWSDQQNLLRNAAVKESPESENAIDDDPFVLIFNDKLYIIWRTSNPNISQDNDIDIVMSSTTDGLNWTIPIELTPAEDKSFNNRPQAAIYNNDLAIVWRIVEENDVGTIVLRIYNESSNQLSKQLKISPINNGGDDYSPDIISFKDQLYIAWVTQDNLTARGDDSDLVIRSVMPNYDTPVLAINIGNYNKYNDDWLIGKSELEQNKKVNVDFSNLLRTLLRNDNWVKTNKIRDEYRNDIFFIPINAYFSGPGRIRLSSLEIKYNYSFLLPDLSFELTEYLKDQVKKDKNKNEDVQIILRFESSSNGRLLINNLKVDYSASTEPKEYPELICIAIFGIILIILGLIIKFSKIKPREHKKEKR